MKAALILLGLCALAFASSIPKWQDQLNTGKNKYKISDKVVLKRQQDVLSLLRNVYQPNYNDEQVTIAQTLSIEDIGGLSIKPQVVDEFVENIRKGLLPKGQIFSVFYEQHLQQAISLFKMLYHAKDYETFYKVASWARQYVNEGMYLYALSVAIVHRPDTNEIVLPPIYEIVPNYFINSEVIEKVQKVKQLYSGLSQTELEELLQEEQRQIALQQVKSSNANKGQWGLSQTGSQKLEQLQAQSQIQQGQKQWKSMRSKHVKTDTDDDQAQQQAIQDQIQQAKLQQLLNGEQGNSKWSMMLQGGWKNQNQKQGLLQQDNLSVQELLEDQLNQGQSGRLQGGSQKPKLVIRANYTTGYLNQNNEESLEYFTEDVGLNAYYYYYNIHNPFWMTSEDVNVQTERRGEHYYFTHQQLVARYYLERLSNGLGSIPRLNYKMPIKTGYEPSLTYSNGIGFPMRPNNVLVSLQQVADNDVGDSNYTDVYQLVKDYERRLRDAIDLGYVITESGKKIDLYESSGTEILGNIIEGNPDSPNNRFYGVLQVVARNLLGNSISLLDQELVIPAALEQPETSLRDPVFYQLYKKLISFVQKYKKNLPEYDVQELNMPGVQIQDVQVDRLITYFDSFDIDATNAVYLSKQEYDDDVTQIQVRQDRLNHKPFTYTINVNSDKTVNTIVRVFIGPKTDEKGRRIQLNDNRLNFVQIDKFVQTLSVGQNVIQRNSRQSYYATDRTTTRELYRRVMSAYNSALEMQLDGSETTWGIPNRLLLPKGTTNGQHFQLYVILTPVQQALRKQSIQQKTGLGQGIVLDNYPLGFPFDRRINENSFDVPNSFMKDVVIYHKSKDDITTQL